MKKKKLAKRLILILLACLLAFAACYGYYAYNTCLAPRVESDYLTYEPFTGKLFDINPRNVKEVFVRRNGEYYDPSEPKEYWMQLYNTSEEIEEIIQEINSFRYAFWVPKTFSYRQDYPAPLFRVSFKNGDWISVILRKNHCLVGVFGERDVWSQGAWYFGSSDLYDAHMAVDIEEGSE